MSDRLRHLQRQQTLLREHLAWIESEIAHETASTETATTQPAATAPSVSAPVPKSSSDSDADALIERYAANERQNPGDLRRGCLLIFVASLLLMAGGVTVVWLMFYR